MKNSVATGQVEAQDKAQVTASVTDPVRPPVGGQPESGPESQPEWFSKRARTFLSAIWNSMAGCKNRPSVIEVEARKTDKTLKKILEKTGV